MEWLPWQDAAVAAGASATATAGLGRRAASRLRAVTAWTRELSVMLALYALWQLAGDLSLGRPADAVRRGREVARAERWLHLPDEAAVQRAVLSYHIVMRAMNVYYAGFHVAVTGVVLVWLFACHRDRYPAVRNVLALVTATSLLIALVPVAPPRLVPGLGVVDAAREFGPSVYPATPRPGLDQLSAMPSLHVGWALVAGGAIVYAGRTRRRWLAALYPALTWWVVVATGNHYWADGLVELVLCAVAVVAVRAWDAHREHPPSAARHDEPARQPVGA